MTRLKAIALFLALGVGITTNLQHANAQQTETTIQGITRTEARIEWARWESKVQARLRWAHYVSRVQARLKARWQAKAQEEETTAPTYGSYSGGVIPAERVAAYARAAGFPESVIPTMVAIAWRESRFNPGAVNPFSGACGLWQMYPCPGPEALFPAVNAAMAYAKYQASGLAPWGY